MRTTPTYLLLIAIASTSFARADDTQDRQALLQKMAARSERFCKGLDNPSPGLASRDLTMHALTLCEAKAHPERLEKLFAVARRMVDDDPKSKTYGNLRWSWKDAGIYDQNAVDFTMQSACLLWMRHRDAMPSAARAGLKELIDFGIAGCLHHKVHTDYTNISLMNAQNLILLGEATGRADVADEGYARLNEQALYYWENGVHEYDSPTYYGVDIESLALIDAFCQREQGRQTARLLLEYFWTDLALNFYPPAQKLAGTCSRDYDYLRGLGHLDEQLFGAGWCTGEAPTPSIHTLLCRWRPPATLKQMSATRFPRLVTQIWGERSCEFKTNYLCSDVTLGSSAACYHTMDIPLAVYFPGPRTGVRCYFIPDGRHDPYGKIKIAEGLAHEKTLHLKPFFAAAQRNADVAALVVYRPKDFPDSTTTLESHFVMPKDADAIFVGGKRVEVSGKKPVSVPVPAKATVVLRKGTAALGVKVAWARGADEPDAPAHFEYDGNEFGAVRLTVEHLGGKVQRRDKATAPAAALVVRIGSGLSNDAAFEKWQAAFAAAPVNVEATADRIALSAGGVDGEVAVAAAAPFDGEPELIPATTRALIACDGEDLGRKILNQIDVVKNYAKVLGQGTPLPLNPSGGTYWEAEQGALVAPMVAGEDAKASGGKFIWMPGEPGGKGGNPAGTASYRLQVPHAGEYYVWGRVMSPTPDDDSFFASVAAGGKQVVPQGTWSLGVHKDWTWVRMTLDPAKGAVPFNLPVGEVLLRVRVREDGAKLDRLFITPSREEQPR